MPTVTEDLQKNPERGKSYWGGFAAGAAIGTGAAVAAVMIANLAGKSNSRVVRLEDSVQIGRHVEDVFRAWMDLESLPDHMEYVNRIRKYGNISEWDVTVDGKDFKWKAETVHVIPNESIGWKSLTGQAYGPHHFRADGCRHPRARDDELCAVEQHIQQVRLTVR